ncbi:MAG: FAD-dependent oxidoreductase, partial [Proteobacteria bacterium]|nr:FAD-dependent oxidoreductase [Pseudomonadota bacterium]
EYYEALEDGIDFHFLTNPEKFNEDGTVVCRVMELGEPDESGRRRPVATDRTVIIKGDLIIPSIGESTDTDTLVQSGLTADNGWVSTDNKLETSVENVFLVGDGRTGPSTIVRCLAEARTAADTITEREDEEYDRQEFFPYVDGEKRVKDIFRKKGVLQGSDGTNKKEASRCIECNYLCNRCVEVCPNRANAMVAVAPEDGFSDPYQVYHIDAFCNECGNCARFCPYYDGKPYKDKFTVFNMMEDFKNSTNPGFYLDGDNLTLRVGGVVESLKVENGKVVSVPDNMAEAAAVAELIIGRQDWVLGSVEK